MDPLRHMRIGIVMLGLFNNAYFVRGNPATAAGGGRRSQECISQYEPYTEHPRQRHPLAQGTYNTTQLL